MDAKVVVFMPVYNRSGYLKESMASILGQTLDDFIFLIIDDGSTDDSTDEVRKFDDSRIIFLENGSNMGIPKTYNRAMDYIREHIDAEYIAYMDSDDRSDEERLAKQYRFMNEHRDIDVCGTQAMYFGDRQDERRKPVDPAYLRCMFYDNSPFINPSVMLRSEIITKHGFRYNEDLIAMSDGDFYFRLKDEFRFGNMEEFLVFQRDHSKRITHERESITNQDNRHIIKLFLKELGIDTNGPGLDIHYDISQSKIDPRFTISEYAAARDELIKANRKRTVYDEAVFQRYVDDVWAVFSASMRKAGLKTRMNFLLHTRKYTRVILRNTLSFKST